jgi:sugar phosphate isomerase/epimerase
MGDRPHLYPPDFDDDELARLKGLLKEKNLKVTNINSFTLFAVGDTYLPSWIEPDKERREIRIRHTLDCLKIAAKLECKNISVPPGGPLNGISRKEALALFHQGLERVIPFAELILISVIFIAPVNSRTDPLKRFTNGWGMSTWKISRQAGFTIT